MAFIVPAALTTSPYTAIYCLTGAMFFLECTIGQFLGRANGRGRRVLRDRLRNDEHGRKHRRGTFATVFGILVQSGSWIAPFIVAAVLLVFGAAIWAFWLKPDVSVIEKGAFAGRASVARTG